MTRLSLFRGPSWPLLFSAALLACGAGDVDDQAPAGGSGPVAAGGSTVPDEPPPPPPSSGGQLLGGAGGGEDLGPPPHPLFGAGNDTGLDLSDPCLTVTRWKAETAIDLEPHEVVLYEGTLWELTGTSSENWALPDCTPPGTGWCGEQYAWKEVGTCPLDEE